MRKTAVTIVLVVVSGVPAVWAQTKPPVAVDRRSEACKPIGRTEDGKLVYSMKCDAIPAAAPKAAMTVPAPEAPAPVVEEDKGGLFGRAPSFIRPTTDQARPAGVGPVQTR